MAKKQKKAKRGAMQQRGFMLLESLVAVAIIGTGILAAVASLSTSSTATLEARENATSAWLGTSQIELIKDAAFVPTPGTYPTVTPPTGYTVQNTTTSISGLDNFIQDVTIQIFKDGELISSVTMVKIDK